MRKKFKKGDLARVIEVDPEDPFEIGDVVEVMEDDSFPIVERLSDRRSAPMSASRQLEHVDPDNTTDFKVGDKVRITGNKNNIEHFLKIGSIGEVRLTGHSTLEVEGESRTHDGKVYQTVSKKDLEKVTTAESMRFELPKDYFSIPTLPPLEFNMGWMKVSEKPTKVKGGGIVRKLNRLASKLLDADTRALVKANVLDDDLRINDTDLVLSFVVEKYKKELAVEARKMLRDEKKQTDEE